MLTVACLMFVSIPEREREREREREGKEGEYKRIVWLGCLC